MQLFGLALVGILTRLSAAAPSFNITVPGADGLSKRANQAWVVTVDDAKVNYGTRHPRTVLEDLFMRCDVDCPNADWFLATNFVTTNVWTDGNLRIAVDEYYHIWAKNGLVDSLLRIMDIPGVVETHVVDYVQPLFGCTQFCNPTTEKVTQYRGPKGYRIDVFIDEGEDDYYMSVDVYEAPDESGGFCSFLKNLAQNVISAIDPAFGVVWSGATNPVRC